MDFDEDWVVIDETAGPGLAEILIGLLEANGIVARLSHEGAWEAFPTSFGQLGTHQVLVKRSEEASAREVLDAFYSRTIETGLDDESAVENKDEIEPEENENKDSGSSPS